MIIVVNNHCFCAREGMVALFMNMKDITCEKLLAYIKNSKYMTTAAENPSYKFPTYCFSRKERNVIDIAYNRQGKKYIDGLGESYIEGCHLVNGFKSIYFKQFFNTTKTLGLNGIREFIIPNVAFNYYQERLLYYAEKIHLPIEYIKKKVLGKKEKENLKNEGVDVPRLKRWRDAYRKGYYFSIDYLLLDKSLAFEIDSNYHDDYLDCARDDVTENIFCLNTIRYYHYGGGNPFTGVQDRKELRRAESKLKKDLVANKDRDPVTLNFDFLALRFFMEEHDREHTSIPIAEYILENNCGIETAAKTVGVKLNNIIKGDVQDLLCILRSP